MPESETNVHEDTPDEQHMKYSPSLEYFLMRKGEECEAWSKLHLMSHKKFKKRETMYNLPIITITAFIGFVSGLNLNYEYIHLILGGMSLYASLLKSYFSYLKISQKSENHRIAYIQYGQIANEIRVELALEPSMRKEPSGLVDLIRIKMKNLLEVSEIIDNAIIDEYLSKLDKTNQNNVLHWFTRERPAATHETNPDEIMLGRPPVLKLANRIESYVDINEKVVLNKHGKSKLGLTTMKTMVVPTGSATPSENLEDLLESGLELEITEPNLNTNYTTKVHEIRGTMV